MSNPKELRPELEAELREMIALDDKLGSEAVKQAARERTTEAEREHIKWLRNRARQLDKLNVKIKDDRLAAVAADLREEADNLSDEPGKPGNRKRAYAATIWRLMTRLTEREGLKDIDAAAHIERLMGSRGAIAESIASSWSRQKGSRKK